MKKTIQWIGKALVAGIGAAIVLNLFCLIYAYDGVHVTNSTGATDYAWEPKQLRATMREGFAWFSMDSHGFNNEKDYWEKPDVLLMGSSNMEAAQVAKNENTGALLNEMMPDYTTYNIGMSGHTIYRCVDNLENALRVHSPKKSVVLVTDSVDLSVEEMQTVTEGKSTPIPSYDSGLMYHMQKIPVVKMIYKQISDWIFLQGEASQVKKKEDRAEYKEALTEFLGKASKIAEESGVTLMIVYQPPQYFDENGDISYEHLDENVALFKQECSRQNILFSDMTDDFTKMYEEEYLLPHGFSNASVIGGHLNKYGHKAIADEIVSHIRELEGN